MTQKIEGSAPAPAVRPAAAPASYSSPAAAAPPPSQGAVAAVAADSVEITQTGAALLSMKSEAKAGPPPMDMAKIEALRAQLAAGTYRVNPMDIARRLDALERELSI